ncbi:MAG: class I SAM-dependent methyltransferase [Rhizobium rhizophilum]|uniref:class I SAM-dependent methyltransferase n=1 Tax=Rhizobium rhizophilum TaxID=1850373 RepID=UPI0039191055
MTESTFCPVCSHPAVIQYKALKDRLYFARPKADYYACSNSKCRHVFAWPTPNRDQIPALYETYSTHAPVALLRKNSKSRLIDLSVALFGLVDDLHGQIRRWRLMDMANRRGAILDVGCGAGNLLVALRADGYDDLTGIDFDPKAVQVAQAAGLNVQAGEVSDVDRRDFDVVLMNHVIEHLPDPEQALVDVFARLKSGGVLIIRTPNSGSYLANFFGSDWRGLEPPRHLHIFSVESMELMARKAGFRPIDVGTTNAMIQGIYLESVDLRLQSMSGLRRRLMRLILRASFPIFVLAASIRRSSNGTSGEEVYAVLQMEV